MAAKAKRREPTQRKTGRPSAYKPEYARQAVKFCMLGATDKDLAEAFAVAESTVYLWKQRHPEFSEALKAGKEQADANVAKSLYRRALGYEHKAVKIIAVAQGNNQGSIVEEVPYVERYPPDTTACIFWLKNRRPAVWRDKQDHEVTGKDGGPLSVTVTHVVIDPAVGTAANKALGAG